MASCINGAALRVEHVHPGEWSVDFDLLFLQIDEHWSIQHSIAVCIQRNIVAVRVEHSNLRHPIHFVRVSPHGIAARAFNIHSQPLRSIVSRERFLNSAYLTQNICADYSENDDDDHQVNDGETGAVIGSGG